MAEQKITFQSKDDIILEGLISEGQSETGVVITHPHPLYGGDMYNIVVETIQQAYRDMGHTTLRFNFRGVGGSSGEFDDGIGEQHDLLAGFNYLNDTGLKSIDLAGYSFGSWVMARICNNIPAQSIIMVSPPAAMMPFESENNIPNLTLVVTGSHDEFAPPDMVEKLAGLWNQDASFEIIRGADHFYFGFSNQLKEVLQEYI